MTMTKRAAGAATLAFTTLLLAGCPGGGIPGMPGLGGTGTDLASKCPKTDIPAAITGGTNLGLYSGTRLPSDFGAVASEADVTAKIKTMETSPDFPCFAKFFPGAYTIYLTKK